MQREDQSVTVSNDSATAKQDETPSSHQLLVPMGIPNWLALWSKPAAIAEQRAPVVLDEMQLSNDVRSSGVPGLENK